MCPCCPKLLTRSSVSLPPHRLRSCWRQRLRVWVRRGLKCSLLVAASWNALLAKSAASNSLQHKARCFPILHTCTQAFHGINMESLCFHGSCFTVALVCAAAFPAVVLVSDSQGTWYWHCNPNATNCVQSLSVRSANSPHPSCSPDVPYGRGAPRQSTSRLMLCERMPGSSHANGRPAPWRTKESWCWGLVQCLSAHGSDCNSCTGNPVDALKRLRCAGRV